MKWPVVAHEPLPQDSIQCAPEQWQQAASAPLSLTHLALMFLGLMFFYCERATIRKAFILGTAYATVMTWYAVRRVTAGSRRRAQARLVSKPPFNPAALAQLEPPKK